MKISASIYSNKTQDLPEVIKDLDEHQIDFFHVDCNDDLANNFYCNGDWIGITEQTYVANTVCDVPGFGYNDPDCPTEPTLLADCPSESGTCNNLLIENDWNQDGLVDAEDVVFIDGFGSAFEIPLVHVTIPRPLNLIFLATSNSCRMTQFLITTNSDAVN